MSHALPPGPRSEDLTDEAREIESADSITPSASADTVVYAEAMVKEPQIDVHEEDRLSKEDGHHDPQNQIHHSDMAPWRPSILRIAPMMGLLALGFTSLQVLASYLVLHNSNGAEVSNWKYQPAVYLAILTAISNKMLAFAAVQGAVVTFWLRVIRGTSLAQMHRDWSYSAWVYNAIFSGRNFSLLALACICASFVAIDGPLLQRATSVRKKIPQDNITLSVSLAPELPSYFSGRAFYNYGDANGMQFEHAFLPIAREYLSNAPIRGAVTGCTGRCAVTLQAPALAIDHCTSESQFRNFSTPLSPKAQEEAEQGDFNGLSSDRLIFDVAFMPINGTQETMAFRTIIATITNDTQNICGGPVLERVCYLVSAIAEYPVVIENDVLSFEGQMHAPKIVAIANNTAITKETVSQYNILQDDGSTASTLAGIATAANTGFRTSLYAVPLAEVFSISGPTTWFTFKHMHKFLNAGAHCLPEFTDPHEEIMASLNELLFRTGVYTALNYHEYFVKKWLDEGVPVYDEGVQVYYNTTGQRLSSVNVFHSDFHFFAAAAVIQLFTVLVILLTFWGWWKLGRNVSFSPLEIGKAFDAPILQSAPTNNNGRAITKIEGQRRIQYGILRRLAWSNGPSEGYGVERMVIADQGMVGEPVGQPFTIKEHCATVKVKMPRLKKRSKNVKDESTDQV